MSLPADTVTNQVVDVALAVASCSSVYVQKPPANVQRLKNPFVSALRGDGAVTNIAAGAV